MLPSQCFDSRDLQSGQQKKTSQIFLKIQQRQATWMGKTINGASAGISIQRQHPCALLLHSRANAQYRGTAARAGTGSFRGINKRCPSKGYCNTQHCTHHEKKHTYVLVYNRFGSHAEKLLLKLISRRRRQMAPTITLRIWSHWQCGLRQCRPPSSTAALLTVTRKPIRATKQASTKLAKTQQ